MIERLESALIKFKDRKENDKLRVGVVSKVTVGQYFKNTGASKELSEDLIQKEKDLKGALNRAINVRKEIAQTKRKLETNFDLDAITHLENDIKNKETILVKLED